MGHSADPRTTAQRSLFSASMLLLLVASQVHAQVGVPIRGRVEDSVSREPVVGARVLSADSSAVTLTDSLGGFSIEIDGDEPLVVEVDRFGYLPRRFELSEDVRTNAAILLLHPAAIELESLDAVAEAATARVHRQLANRRNAYFGALRVMDRANLQRFGPGNVWDFVRLRVPWVFQCSSALSGLCSRGRGRTSFISSYDDGNPVLVCLDGWESWGAVGQLSTLNMRDVELVEIYNHGRGGIKVYTAAYIEISARTGRNVINGLGWPC